MNYYEIFNLNLSNLTKLNLIKEILITEFNKKIYRTFNTMLQKFNNETDGRQSRLLGLARASLHVAQIRSIVPR